MLHVLDGDATLPDFRKALLPGDVVVWREALLEGPWPRALRGVDEAIRATREAMQKDDEIVLWFDADLFCRLHAAYYAAHFVGARMTNALGSHADRTDLKRLWEQRFAVDPALAEVWHAYVAADPRALVPLAARFPWVRLHLERFPHERDGLGATERRILEALRDGGPLALPELFRRASDPALGIGDLQVQALADELAPLVERAGERWKLTQQGRDVLEGRAQRAPPRERMLGGARAAAWRWDGATLTEA